jgi:hypothetical protein
MIHLYKILATLIVASNRDQRAACRIATAPDRAAARGSLTALSLH